MAPPRQWSSASFATISAPTRFAQLLLDILMRAEPIPKCELGELRDPETHLIPRAMMAIQGHINDFAVFGTDYPTPDGTAIRDYIHVSDLAEAHVAALQHLLAGKPGGAFNLGTGSGYSVKQVLDAIAAETGESYLSQMHLGAKVTRRSLLPMPR